VDGNSVQEAKLNSIWFGSGGDLKVKASQYIQQIAA
jgi:hypothetical protein